MQKLEPHIYREWTPNKTSLSSCSEPVHKWECESRHRNALSAARLSLSTYLQSFPRYLRRRISRTQYTKLFEEKSERASEQEAKAGRQASASCVQRQRQRQLVHPRYRSRRRGNAAAITDIVAARNGGE